jgi:hypothetical protein
MIMAKILSLLGLGPSRHCKELEAKMEAVSRSQAIIEFDMVGNILSANNNFLAVMGYRQDELVGQHHRIFVGEDYRESADYQTFWSSLARGEHRVEEFKRVR